MRPAVCKVLLSCESCKCIGSEICVSGWWNAASLSMVCGIWSVQASLFIWRWLLGGARYYKLHLELKWNSDFNFWACHRLSLWALAGDVAETRGHFPNFGPKLNIPCQGGGNCSSRQSRRHCHGPLVVSRVRVCSWKHSCVTLCHLQMEAEGTSLCHWMIRYLYVGTVFLGELSWFWSSMATVLSYLTIYVLFVS